MHLTNLTIDGLHGSINKFVEFKPELNLLVGINGSGKTSVLNAIEWLLSVNVQRLCTTEFVRLALQFTYKSYNLELEAVQDKGRLSLNLHGYPKREFSPFVVELLKAPKSIKPAEHEMLLEHYGRLGPDKKEKALWDFMTDIPKPVAITLDRTISAEFEDVKYLEHESSHRVSRRRPTRSPLDKVREVTAVRYAQYRAKVIELNDGLKAGIVISALSQPANTRRKSAPKISPAELNKLEVKVTDYLASVLRGKDENAQIGAFFRSAKTLIRKAAGADKASGQDMLYMMFARQYQQIDSLAQAFNVYETASAHAYESLKTYLDRINQFLADSKKTILFDEQTNELCFKFLREDGSSEESTRSIDYLSSGERQIIILFTFLAFVATPDSIFIVDEPELSLHPKWQRDFLDSFAALKPKNTQLLLATHSPEIAGKRKADCITLKA